MKKIQAFILRSNRFIKKQLIEAAERFAFVFENVENG
jgi:hypothetical protein